MEEILNLFKSDLSSGNLEYMVDAANKLTIVAVAIGQDATLNELLPYLHQITPSAPDEVLAAFARQLYFIYDIAQVGKQGANSDSMKIIFALLKTFGQDEEIVVRDAGIQSFFSILSALDNEAINLHVFPLFRALAMCPEFGSRYSAGYIFPQVYRVSPPTAREEFRQILIALSQDESPIVRARLAGVLPQFCEVVNELAKNTPYTEITQSYDLILNTVIPILQQLALDERDHLREVASSASCKIVPFIPLQDYQNFIVPLITALSDDLSWKVRQTLCLHLPLFIANLIKRATYQYKTEAALAYPSSQKEEQEFKNAMMPGGRYDLNKYIGGIFNLFKLFLQVDSNIEVRGSGVLIMVDMIQLSQGIIPADLHTSFPRLPMYTAEATEEDSLNLEQQFPSPSPAELAKPYQRGPAVDIFKIDHSPVLASVGAGFYDLVQSISSLTKVDLCETFGKIAPFVGVDYITRYIIPVINILAQDDNVQVRSSVILCLTPIIQTCPPAIISTQIWPLIEGLGADLRWRVRRAVTTQLSALCFCMKGDHKFISTSLMPLIEGLFSENVHAVRNRMAVEFRNLTTILGAEQIVGDFLPWCRDLFNPKANYLHRITALHFIYFTSTAYNNAASKAFIQEQFTSYFIEALQDQVPNVRILAIRYIMLLLQQKQDSPWDGAFVRQHFIPHFQAMAQDHNQDREVIYQGNQALKLVETLM